jgi:7-carboxy-7-deazaguanine synthase
MGADETETIRVCERFRSLQGETRDAGLPATFVRLSGCNLRCRYCDTAYAQAPEAGERVGVDALLAELRGAPPGDLVVVTGGEPLLQPGVLALLARLADQGRAVLLETNGSQDITGVDERVRRIVDVKGPGSGQQTANRWANLAALRPLDEVKFVVSHREDFEFAAQVVARYGLLERCGVLLSPVRGLLPPQELARWILEAGRPLRLQLQLHRLLWPGRDRGV